MKKLLVLFIVICFILPFVKSAPIEIKKQDNVPVILVELEEPAIFSLEIINNGVSDYFEIFSLAGVFIEPSIKIPINSSSSVKIDVKAHPFPDVKQHVRGLFKFEYEVYSKLNGIVKTEQLFKIVSFQDVFQIDANHIAPEDKSIILTIHNLENRTFNGLSISADSQIFKETKIISINPYETINLTFPIDKQKTSKLLANTYNVKYTLKFNNIKAEKEGSIKYLEGGRISVEESKTGFVVRKKTITKKNEGNVPIVAIITEKRDIITRLITTLSSQPSQINKKGFSVTYNWEKQLAPSESLIVTTTTNYTFPLISLLIILLAVGVTYILTIKPLTINKRVTHVKTKNGEFALKISLHLKSRSKLSNVKIIDRIPQTMKLYERYGVKPHTINESTRQISWNIGDLNSGEERIFSYIIYSKIRMVGQFTLPLAHATFTKNNVKKTISSNKTSFLSESVSN